MGQKLAELSPPPPDPQLIEDARAEEELKQQGKPVTVSVAVKDRMKGIEDSAILQMTLELDKISLKLLRTHKELSQISIQKLKTEFVFGTSGDVSFTFALKNIEIVDLRKNVQLRYFITNPFLFEPYSDENKDIKLFELKFDFKPNDDLFELDLNISGIQIMPSVDFVGDLMRFFMMPMQENAKDDQSSTQPVEQKPVERPVATKTQTMTKTKISFNLNKFEV